MQMMLMNDILYKSTNISQVTLDLLFKKHQMTKVKVPSHCTGMVLKVKVIGGNAQLVQVPN